MSSPGRKAVVLPAYAVVVLALVVLMVWGVRKVRKKKRFDCILRNGKVLDLRDEGSFRRARIRGSYNIPADSLWGDNRWYELPEQHEHLLVLLPSEHPKTLANTNLEEEIVSRRAQGATTTRVADQELLRSAKESGLLEEGAPTNDSLGSASTLFTPSRFLAKVVAAEVEPNLDQDGIPKACIDIGCGAGRDAVWLALRGWQVTAMDCWEQARRKALQLAERMRVSARVDAVRGKVKTNGDIHVWMEPRASHLPFADGVCGAGGERSPSRLSGLPAADGCDCKLSCDRGPRADCILEEQIIRPSTPLEEFDAYGLVVVVRFLERAAFETLARLVDPRGGYLLVSTFVEEEAEALPKGGEPLPLPQGGNRKGGGGVESYPLRALDERSPHYGDIFGPRAINDRSQDEPVVVEGHLDAKDGETTSTRDVPSLGSRRGGNNARSGGTRRKASSRGTITGGRKSQEEVARWPHSNPRDPGKILRRGELAEVFGDLGFEVLEDSVERLADGRPVACFLARKRKIIVDYSSSTSSDTSPAQPGMQTPPTDPLSGPLADGVHEFFR